MATHITLRDETFYQGGGPKMLHGPAVNRLAGEPVTVDRTDVLLGRVLATTEDGYRCYMWTWYLTPIDDNAGQVPEGLACPTCGNRDIDTLGLDDDGDTVTCCKCGTIYTVGYDPDGELD